MDLIQCQIHFDEPKPVYFAGQNVSGKLTVSSKSMESIKAIYVEIKGLGTVKWVESKDKRARNSQTERNDTTETVTTEHTNEELYLAEKRAVYQEFGETLGNDDYVSEFNFTLPREIPSSFEGDHGRIRYTVSAIVETDDTMVDHETTRTINVISSLDLNENPQLAEPISASKSKTFRSLLRTSGTINIKLSLPAGGAVPGETLYPTLEIENLSKIHLSNIELSFQRRVSYKASNGNKKSAVRMITSKNLGNIQSRESKTFQEEAVYIPMMPVINLKKSSIVDLDYFLRVNFIPPGYRSRCSLKVPVVIGTRSPGQKSDQSDPPAVEDRPPIGWNIPTPTSALAAGVSSIYPNLPPPGYEEAIFLGGTSAASSIHSEEEEEDGGDADEAEDVDN